jgi:heme exporter protein CcmB
MNIYFTVVMRDLRLALRRKSEVLSAMFFFVVVAALFPLAIGPGPATLRQIGPGVLWVGALLASMLALSRLFEVDYRDGTLEQMLLSPHALWLLVLGKMTAHWLLAGLPLVLLAPVLGLQFQLSSDALSVLCITLLLGTPVLSCVGAIGAALTLGGAWRRGLDFFAGAASVCPRVGVWRWRGASPAKRFGGASPCIHLAGIVVASLVFQPLGLQCGFAHCDGMSS